MKDSKSFRKEVEKAIKERWGAINKEWEAQIDMLIEEYETYVAVKQFIKEHGVVQTNRFGDFVSSPALNQAKVSFNNVTKLCHEFGITPLSMSKAKKPQKETNDEEIINSLFN